MGEGHLSGAAPDVGLSSCRTSSPREVRRGRAHGSDRGHDPAEVRMILPERPDAADLAAELATVHVLAGGVGDTEPEDLLRAAASLWPALQAAGSPLARDWDLEPASHFDPEWAFGVPATAWPESGAAAPSEGDPGRAGSGSLLADLAAAAAGTPPEEIAARYRQRIAEHNPVLHAFLTVCGPDHPQALPRRADDGCTTLVGACIALKDIIATAGLRTTAASAQRAQYVPERDAACWVRLRQAGALCLGKTHTQEFAAGATTETDHFGPAHNPHDPARVPGGSSGGSAAAVAAALCSAALGTDTAGSVRIPAACCGVVGLKPTYGRVSRAGVFVLSWSLDHIGPIARTVREAALLFATLAGPDPQDPTTLRRPVLPPVAQLGLPRIHGLRGVRIGVPWSWLDEAGTSAPASGGMATTPGIRAAFAQAVQVCRDLGAQVLPCDLGPVDFLTAVNRLIALPESSAWHAPHLDLAPQLYGQRIRGRLLGGRYLPAEAYLQGQRLRTLLSRRYAAALSGPDGLHLIATPTLPTPPPAIGAPPEEGLALLRFCAPFNVVGWPAISLPCGTDAEGLPIGLQLAAAPFAEPELLSAAATLEAAWTRAR